MRAASLQVNAAPGSATLLLDGQMAGVTPLFLTDLAPGVHRLKLTGEQYEDWSGEVTLKSGETAAVNAGLVLKKGAIRVTANIDGADVYVDGALAGRTPAAITTVYGSHAIRVEKLSYKTVEQSVEVRGPGPIPLTVKLEVAMAVLTVSGAPRGAEFILDELKVSLPATAAFEVHPGEHVLSVQAPGYEKAKYKLQYAPGETKNVQVALREKTRGRAAMKSFLVPGMGQSYAGKKSRAIFYPLFQAGALAGVFLSVNQYNTAVDAYDQTRQAYTLAVSESDISMQRQDMQDKYDAISRAESQRTLFIAAAAGVWVWNVLDALIWPPQKSSAPGIGSSSTMPLRLCGGYDRNAATLGLSWRF